MAIRGVSERGALRLNDAKGRPVILNEIAWLTVRFGNPLYRVNLFVSDRLGVDVIIVTAFLNRHVVATKCGDQKTVPDGSPTNSPEEPRTVGECWTTGPSVEVDGRVHETRR